MAHVEKYPKMATGHMIKHYERSEDIVKQRDNIDATKTHLNYNLLLDTDRGQELLKKRLEEVYCLKRKDVNVMCDWVVTAPKTLPEERQREFFKQTYNFLSERYGGEQNVISACVHMDESQPHLHFAFVPVVWDKKKNKYKVSAKEVVNRKDLQTFHKALQEYLELKMCIPVEIQNNATLEGNKSIDELKRGTAIQDIVEKRHNALVELEDIKDNIAFAEDDIKQIRSKLEGLKKIDISNTDLKQKEHKSLFGHKVKSVTIDKNVYDKLIAGTTRTRYAEHEKKDLQKKLERVEQSASYQTNKHLKETNKNLLENNLELKYTNSNLQKQLEKALEDKKQLAKVINKIFELYPEVKQRFIPQEVKKEKKHDRGWSR